ILAWAVQAWGTMRWRAAVLVTAVYVLISSTAFCLIMLSGPLRAHRHVGTFRGTITIDDTDHSLEIVQRSLTQGEKMFVYPYEPLYYYLTGTFSPTRYDFLQPGMHTPEQFQESLRALEADQTHVVLLDTTFKQRLSWISPNAPADLFSV